MEVRHWCLYYLILKGNCLKCARHFMEIHQIIVSHCPVPRSTHSGMVSQLLSKPVGSRVKAASFQVLVCVLPLMWKCFPLLFEQQLLFAAASNFFLRVFWEFSKRSCFLPSSQFNFFFPSLLAVDNRQRPQRSLLKASELWSERSACCGRVAPEQGFPAVPGRDEARVKRAAIQANATLGSESHG